MLEWISFALKKVESGREAASRPSLAFYSLLTTHYSLLTTHYQLLTSSFKNSLHPAPANTPVSPAPSAYSPPATASKPHLPRRICAAPRSCSTPRYKRALPGKRPRCRSSSKAAQSESSLRSLALTLTVEALAKSVNPCNPAFCPPFTILLSPAHSPSPRSAPKLPFPARSDGFVPPNPFLFVARGNLPARSHIVVVKGERHYALATSKRVYTGESGPKREVNAMTQTPRFILGLTVAGLLVASASLAAQGTQQSSQSHGPTGPAAATRALGPRAGADPTGSTSPPTGHGSS
jgi:hypothetical protein